MKDVHLPKPQNGRTRHLSPNEAQRLLQACAPDLRILVLTALHTGFRKSEIRSLKWSAVDLVHGSVTVECCYSKNGESRTVPLSPDLAVSLQTLKDERKPKPDDHVFLHEGHEWLAWRKSFNAALKLAGITNFRFHDTRHCFGSWLAQNGVSDQGRMELMGHKDHAMTRRYSHLTPGYKQKAVASLPQFGKAVLDGEVTTKSGSEASENVLAFSR